MTLPQRIALDANFIVDACDGVADAMEALRLMRAEKCRLIVPVPVWAEIARGVKYGGLGRIARIGARPASMTSEAAVLLGEVLASRAKDCPCGKAAWQFDAMIFACAVTADCGALVTRNLTHFDPLAVEAKSLIQIVDAAGVIALAVLPATLPPEAPKPKAAQSTQYPLFPPRDE